MVRKLKEANDTDNKLYIINGEVDVEIFEDYWDEGQLDYVNGYSFRVTGRFISLQQLVKAVADTGYCCSDDIKDWSFSEEQSALQTSALVDNDNNLADDYEIEQWKQGKLKLYDCDTFVSVSVISQPRDVTVEEARASGVGDVF